jgi:hypothetical protein
MTAVAGERLIARALGAGVLRAAKEGRARDVLVLLLTDHMDVMQTPEGARFALALAVRIRGAATDTYIPSGRIGKLDLRQGVYTAYDVFRLAAQDLARKGLARQVSAAAAGRASDRAGVSVIKVWRAFGAARILDAQRPDTGSGGCERLFAGVAEGVDLTNPIGSAIPLRVGTNTGSCECPLAFARCREQMTQ